MVGIVPSSYFAVGSVDIDGTHVFENNGFEVCIVFRVSPQSKFLFLCRPAIGQWK
jgi:hypothetical protein